MPSNDNALFCMVLPPIAWYCMLLHGMAQYCILILLLHCIAWYLMVLNGSKLSPFMPQCGHKLCWVRVCHASVASLPILCCCWGLVCPKKVGQVGGSVAVNRLNALPRLLGPLCLVQCFVHHPDVSTQGVGVKFSPLQKQLCHHHQQKQSLPLTWLGRSSRCGGQQQWFLNVKIWLKCWNHNSVQKIQNLNIAHFCVVVSNLYLNFKNPPRLHNQW